MVQVNMRKHEGFWQLGLSRFPKALWIHIGRRYIRVHWGPVHKRKG